MDVKNNLAVSQAYAMPKPVLAEESTAAISRDGQTEFVSSKASMAARAYAAPQVNFGSIINSKFKVEMLPEALKEFNKIPTDQQRLLGRAYKTIEQQGLNQVMTKALKGLKDVFEIKVGRWRALYTYGPDNSLIIGSVCKKQAQNLSNAQLKAAEARLRGVIAA